MNRLVLGFLVLACVTPAADAPKQSKKPADMSNMPADAHAPLFQAPKSQKSGSITERVAAGLPKPAPHTGRMARKNFIDEHIFGKMERDGIPHAPLATDQEFLRRLTLDLTGRIPTPGDVRAFLADTSPDKRARLIDRLIGSEGLSTSGPISTWTWFGRTEKCPAA
jgi:hypothetical protein